MTSMTCLVIGGAVMVMTTWRWVAKQRYAVHAIIGSLVALSVCALFIDTGGSLIESLGRDTSLTGRTGIWKAVLSVHSDPIFGAGFESFWTGSRLNKIWDMTAVGIQEAHNGYLEVYLNIGWVGVLFLAGVIISGYRYAVAVFRSDPYAGMLRLGIITAGVIYSISEAGFRMMSPIWIVLLLAVTRDPVGIQRKECQRVLRPVKHKSYFQKRSRLLIWKLR
jgi:O-antigen ligase